MAKVIKNVWELGIYSLLAGCIVWLCSGSFYSHLSPFDCSTTSGPGSEPRYVSQPWGNRASTSLPALDPEATWKFMWHLGCMFGHLLMACWLVWVSCISFAYWCPSSWLYIQIYWGKVMGESPSQRAEKNKKPKWTFARPNHTGLTILYILDYRPNDIKTPE